MGAIARAWISGARLRRRLARFDRGEAARRREELIRRHAPGRSFLDVGCMWGANGRFAFLAEEVGACSVTGFDAMPPTPEYGAEHARRSSGVRYVQGDLHDPAHVQEAGRHDVTFCNAVVYHSPSPFRLLEHLHWLTGDLLILGSHTIPEVPGIEQACVFYPGLSEPMRGALRGANPAGMQGISTPFDRSPLMAYANFCWGLSQSALFAMLELAGFEIVEKITPQPFYADVLARRLDRPPSVPPVESAWRQPSPTAPATDPGSPS